MIPLPPTSTLFPYTTLFRSMFRKPETEVFATLQELGIGFTAYSPTNRGFLGGSLTEYADMKTNDIRGEIGRATSELQSQSNLVCRLLLEKKKKDMAT